MWLENTVWLLQLESNFITRFYVWSFFGCFQAVSDNGSKVTSYCLHYDQVEYIL